MKRLVWLLLYALVVPGLANADDIDGATVASYFDAAFAIERNEHELAGAVVSVVRNGEVIFEKGYGYADLEKRIPADPQRSLYRIASISKTFTWTAVMQLVEQGKLDLDADIATYLDFDIPKTFPEPIRMRDLMTHTPGFEERGIGSDARTPEQMPPLGEYLASHIPGRVRKPGLYSSYSNYGTALAGYVVERVSGMPWANYLEERIFQPVGMHSTTARQPLPEALNERRAIGYKFNDGKFEAQPFELLEPTPAGAISTTADDMTRYMLAHLQFGRLGDVRILEEATARRMQSELFRHDPDVNPFLHGFYRTDRNGVVIFGHAGDINQFHSQMALFPDQQLGVFVSFNSDPGAQARNMAIAGFIDRFFPEDLPTDPGVRPDSLAEYAGEWAFMRRNHTTLERAALLNGGIGFSPTEDGELRMVGFDETSRWVPISKDHFRRLYNDDRLVFHRDNDGRVTTAFMSTNLTSGLERLSTLESPKLHQWLFGIAAAIGLASVLGYGWRMFVRASTAARLPWWHVLLAAVLGAMVIAQLTGLVYGLTTDTDQFNYGLPAFVVGLLWLAKVVIVTALIVAVLAVLHFVRANGSVGARTRYAVAAASGLVFCWQLWFWNLL